MSAERNPTDLFPSFGPLRLEGVGSLEAARSAATGGRVCVRRVPATPIALEAIAAARNLPKHPALAAVLDSGTWQGDAWFVTDFPEGQLLGEGAAPVAADAMGARFAPLADALAAMHRHGTAYGLLSGDAVLMAADGRWLLHDAARAGVDRATDRRPEQTALAQLHRGSAFFSPQRLKGGAPTPADDVYALGVLMCLCGWSPRPPRGTALEQLHAVMTGAWKPQIPDGWPASLKALVAAMLSAEAAARPSAADVARRLVAPTPEPVKPEAPLFPVRGTPDIPAPAPTAPGLPNFDPPPFDQPLLIPPLRPAPAPAPTVPTFVPPPLHVQVGGAALEPRPPRPRGSWLSEFTVSIAASDARLIAAGLVSFVMLASTVALGAHVYSTREEAAELAAAKLVRPPERSEPRYSADQLKQILRQKEEARHEY